MESDSAFRNADVAIGAAAGRSGQPQDRPTSLDKALELCEVLAGADRGLSIKQLAQSARMPAPTVHRLLAVLRRRGYVRQDEETGRYALTLKMLDLSFRWLGRSELRLHAYPVVREYVLRTGARAFIALTATGEVTYVWAAGPDEVAMHTTYGREMPAHCALYVREGAASARRLSCLKLVQPGDVSRGEELVRRFGTAGTVPGGPRLNCTCAPVFDYTGREVARVGLFGHGADDRALCADTQRHAWELARLVSVRLGHLPAAAYAVTA
jgi:IclR family acetate operon transcriptional repressor